MFLLVSAWQRIAGLKNGRKCSVFCLTCRGQLADMRYSGGRSIATNRGKRMESNPLANCRRSLVVLTCLLLGLVTLSGCVGVKSLPHQSYVNEQGKRVHCTQHFPKWQLGMDMPTDSCGGNREAVAVCLVFFGVSAVVSGSVYAVGNVLHWAERDGDCTARAELVVSPNSNKPLSN